MWRKIVLVAAMAVLAVAGSACAAVGNISIPSRAANAAVSQQANGTPLGKNVAFYPSTIRLTHSGNAILSTYTSFSGSTAKDPIFESTDDGKTFSQIATIAPDASKGLCCTSLYELPRQVGSLPAGTVLWAGAKNTPQAPPMSLPIYQSQDQGHTWTYLSSCATSPNSSGLWEPELSVDRTGNLDCYFSDESDPAHSQKLSRTVSSDGVHWGPEQDVISPSDPTARPGMAGIRQLPDGRYFMAYEMCSTNNTNCPVYFRTSGDGSSWGAATQITGPDGRFPMHTPKFTVTSNGSIVLTSQVYDNADGSPADGNGQTLLVNNSDGSGAWSEATAPVSAPDAATPAGSCVNYSPALLPVADDNSILEITTNQSDGKCRAFAGIAGLSS